MGEVRIEDQITVGAPPGAVWQAIKDPTAHAAWHPFIESISGEHARGATRACVVEVGKKTGHTKEVGVEEEAGRRMVWRIDEDSSGFLRLVSNWRAGFRLAPADGGTNVIAESIFEPKNMLVRLMLPMVRRKFHGAQRAILAGLKTAVERRSPASGGPR